MVQRASVHWCWRHGNWRGLFHRVRMWGIGLFKWWGLGSRSCRLKQEAYTTVTDLPQQSNFSSQTPHLRSSIAFKGEPQLGTEFKIEICGGCFRVIHTRLSPLWLSFLPQTWALLDVPILHGCMSYTEVSVTSRIWGPLPPMPKLPLYLSGALDR